MYNFTITVENEYNSVETLTGAVSRVYYMNGGQEVDITPVGDTYSAPENVNVRMTFEKEGFQSSDGNFNLTSDNYAYTKTLIPAYAKRFQAQYYSVNRYTGKASITPTYWSGTLTLYEKNGNQWDTVEIRPFGGQYCYLMTVLDTTKTYKMLFEDGSCFPAESAEFSTYPNYVPKTWLQDYTLFKFSVEDAVTHEPIDIQPESISTTSYPTQYNTSLSGYLIKTGGEVTVTAVFSNEGYDTYTYTYTTDGTPTYERDETISMVPTAGFTVTAEDYDTGSEVTGFTATLSLNGTVLETSTDGSFTTQLDGTSTYELEVEKSGYETATVTGTSFDTVTLRKIYTLTISGPVKDQFTNQRVDSWSFDVYRLEGSTKIYAENLGGYAYGCAAGYTWYYEPIATGYYVSGATEIGALTQDRTITGSIQMTPESDAICRARYFTQASGTGSALQYPTTYLYKSISGDWVLIETHEHNTTSNTNYYIEKNTLEASSQYKFVITSDDSFDIVIPFETDSEDTPSGNWGSNAWYYTHSVSSWLFNVTATDAITGQAIIPSLACYYEAAPEGEDFSDNWEQLTYVSNLGGYLVVGEDAKKYRVKLVASLPGYDTETVILNLGTVDDPFIEMASYTEAMELTPTMLYTDLMISVEDKKHGTPITDATITVTETESGTVITPVQDIYKLIYNWQLSYTITVSKPGYETFTDEITPENDTPITLVVELEKLPVYADLYVVAKDDLTGRDIEDAVISVYDITAEQYVEPTGSYWKLLAEEDHEYRVEIEADKYYDYESDTFTAPDTTPIYMTCEMEPEPTQTALTVTVTDQDTGSEITDADIMVKNETTGRTVERSADGKWYLTVDPYTDQYYKVYVSKTGYYPAETAAFPALDEKPILKTVSIEAMLMPFATVNDLRARTGIAYTSEELERINQLLIDVSNLIRSEGRKAGVDVDAQYKADRVYKSVVTTVTCDVTQRVLRQTQTGDAMSQESQSALGYSWSGTYAVPGGGIAMSLMRNEKDILGFNYQTIGVIELC